MDVSNETSVVKHIDTIKYKVLLDEGIIADGMLPKLENCFHALNNNVNSVCLGNMFMLDKDNDLFTTITL
jgi:acetylglutamate kinase